MTYCRLKYFLDIQELEVYKATYCVLLELGHKRAADTVSCGPSSTKKGASQHGNLLTKGEAKAKAEAKAEN